MKILAIDIGYGHVKIVYKKDGKMYEVKLPTAVSYASNNVYSTGSQDNVYAYEKEKYYVGEDALQDAFDSRSPDFLIKYAPLFVAHAIKLIGMRIADLGILSTGISILNWKRKSELEARLKTFMINGVRYNFSKVIVAPQGQGIIYDADLEHERNIVVVDGGFLTLDGLPYQNGNIVNGAFANHNGVSKIVEEVQEEVIQLTDVDYTLPEINKIIEDGFVMHQGEKVDLKAIIKTATTKYVEVLMSTLKTKMSSQLSKANKVVISGGLAYFLADVKMPKNVIYSKRAEFANARGYFKIAESVR